MLITLEATCLSHCDRLYSTQTYIILLLLTFAYGVGRPQNILNSEQPNFSSLMQYGVDAVKMLNNGIACFVVVSRRHAYTTLETG